MRILYAKYNRERLPKFQTETAVCEENGMKHVRKKALCEQAKEHIQTLYTNYQQLNLTYQNVKIATAELKNQAIFFEYVQGLSFDSELAKTLRQKDKTAFWQLLNQYRSWLASLSPLKTLDVINPFDSKVTLEAVPCLETADIDLIFENVFWSDNDLPTIIDYEWVFPNMPINFILYRSLEVFYHKYRDYFSGFMTLDEIYDQLQMDHAQLAAFNRMEQGFQNYVHGKTKPYCYASQYLKGYESFQDIYANSQRVPELLAWGNSLDAVIREKEARIEELAAWGTQLDARLASLDKYRRLVRLGKLFTGDFTFEQAAKRIPLLRLSSLLTLDNAKKAGKKLLRGEIASLFTKSRERLSRELDSQGDLPDQTKRLLYHREKQALVTVTIPVYNNAEYLQRCIESALAQSYENLEVLAVDDCSTDAAVYDILRSFEGNPRFRWFKKAANSGISATMNEAIIAAKGQWIAFLDCDDWLDEQAVAKLVQALDQSEAAVYGYTDRVNEFEATKQAEIESFRCRPTERYFKELLVGMYTSHLKIIHRDVFLTIGLHESRFDGAQDYDIALKTAFHLGDKAFCYLPEPVYHHRIHAKQTTQEAAARIEKIVAAIRREAKLRQAIATGTFDKLISFVVLSFEKKEMTLECVEAIERTVKAPYEIIIFDNASSEATKEFLRLHVETKAQVHVHYSPQNLGCPGGRREAVKLANGDYIIQLDNDVFVTPHCVEELLVRAESDVAIGAVCCKTVFPDGKLQFNGGALAIQDDFVIYSLIDTGKDETELETALWHECGWVPGGATLFKRSVIDELDYSSGYVNAFEDNDISLQIKGLGKTMVNCPTAKVVHHHIMYHPKQAQTETEYMQARYKQDGFVQSLLHFYERNQLIIQDEYVYGFMGLKGQSEREIRRKVQELVQGRKG
ncbi:MAG: glycosyltransferase [Sporomusaceae bacterium]|nr:glycosyltransferase [Sporomusaceae bacterium]